MRHALQRVLSAGLVVTAVVLELGAVAGAHGGNSDPNAIHACVQKANGSVRIVGTAGTCTNAEGASHWAISEAPEEPATNWNYYSGLIDLHDESTLDFVVFNPTSETVTLSVQVIPPNDLGLIEIGPHELVVPSGQFQSVGFACSKNSYGFCVGMLVASGPSGKLIPTARYLSTGWPALRSDVPPGDWTIVRE